MSPVDKTMVQMMSKYEEDGKCVATRSTYSDGVQSQEIRRYIIEDGSVYLVKNRLTVGPGQARKH